MAGLTTMPFGKHKGKPFAEIPVEDCQWMLDNLERLKPDLRALLAARIKQANGSGRAARVHDPDAVDDGAKSSGGEIPCPSCGALLMVTLRDDGVPF